MGLFATTTSIETYWVGNSFSGLTSLASDIIDDAETEVKKRLSERYDMSSAIFNTTTSIPPQVRTLTLWFSLSLLYGATSRGSKDSFNRADWWEKKFNKNVDMVVGYKANLTDSSGSAVVDDTTNNFIMKSNTTDYTETFQEDDPLNWQIDADKVDDIEGSR